MYNIRIIIYRDDFTNYTLRYTVGIAGELTQEKINECMM